MRHRILLHTNPPWIKTGLAENAKTLLKYLYKTGKYEIAHYCSQASVADHNLSLTPWKSYGCLPTDPNLIQQLNSDPGKARDASYGSLNIDSAIKDFKPTIAIFSDDIWAFSKGNYLDKPWYKKINSILHITIDSIPILEQAYEQADNTQNYYTWAKFAEKEMKRMDSVKYGHVKQIYGAMDTTKFSVIPEQQKNQLRKSFGISEDATVFLFVGRNQLRKSFPQVIQAFAQFKKDNPDAKAKLHFHTSFSEKGQGWDIPKLAKYYGVDISDILATYVCKTCGQWIIHPYVGEDINCPYCKSEKSMVTATIVHGVPDDQMKLLYGFSDGCISAFTSGGQEYHSVQSLLCGKPLACTNYSCGEDFCEQPFVHALGFNTYFEQGTNFAKSTTDVRDIKRFMTKILKSSKKELQEWGDKGRIWATKTFSIETIGAQWEALFDSLPVVDWDKIELIAHRKNDKFPFPEIEDENQFLSCLYKNILNMYEPDHGSGFLNWKNRLKEGVSRRSVYDFFIGVAREENGKNFPQQDASILVDKTTGKKRAIFTIKESLGDSLVCTQLFEAFHQAYPNHDLYVGTLPTNFEIFHGNPYVFKVLAYQPFMEQEMVCIGAGQSEGLWDVYLYPATPTQNKLGYLSSSVGSFEKDIKL